MESEGKICISVPTLELKAGKGNGAACHLLYELRGCRAFCKWPFFWYEVKGLSVLWND